MKAIILSLAILATMLSFVPTADAVGTCDTVRHPDCPGIVCIGYSNGHWQRCVRIDPTIIDLCRYMDNCVILED